MALLHPLNPKKRFLYYGFSWGDWVAPGTSMQEQIKRAKWLATEYLAYSAHILALAAGHLGKEKEAEKYSALEARIKKCFCDNYLDEKGHIRGGFQSAYAVALCYDVLPDAARKTALDDLEKDVVSRGYHLSTGFPGTLHLPFALLDNGRIDTAFRLLLQDSCPSWLYPVKCGATSVWERWDALREDGSLNTERVGSNNICFRLRMPRRAWRCSSTGRARESRLYQSFYMI
jgi:alpha-L-rhamnosidase